MIITMTGQLKQLAVMFVCGFVAALVYDHIRLFRRMVPHNNFFIAIEDIFFWFFGTVFAYSLILWLDFGQIRAFMLMGVFLGALFYYLLISPVFLKTAAAVFETLYKIVYILLYPIRVTLQTLDCMFEYFVNFFKKLLKKCLKYGKIYMKYIKAYISDIIKSGRGS